MGAPSFRGWAPFVRSCAGTENILVQFIRRTREDALAAIAAAWGDESVADLLSAGRVRFDRVKVTPHARRR